MTVECRRTKFLISWFSNMSANYILPPEPPEPLPEWNYCIIDARLPHCCGFSAVWPSYACLAGHYEFSCRGCGSSYILNISLLRINCICTLCRAHFNWQLKTVAKRSPCPFRSPPPGLRPVSDVSSCINCLPSRPPVSNVAYLLGPTRVTRFKWFNNVQIQLKIN